MSNISIVIGREYTTRVKKKSFIILTILMPFLMVAMVTVPMLLGMIKSDEKKEVVVLDQTGKYAQLFFDAQKADSTSAEGYTFVPAKAPLADYQKAKTADGDDADVTLVCITDDLAEHPEAVKIYSTGEVQRDLSRYVEDLLNEQIRKDKVKAYDIPGLENAISDLQKSFSIETVKWTKDGDEASSSTEIAMVLGMISALLIYMFVLCYGAMVMQGVMEEKTNRIIEVLVGSVKPFELMMGKIIGVMLVGFTQILIWGAMLVAITTIAGLSLAPSMPAADITQNLTPEQAEALAASGQQAALQAMQDSPVSELLTMLGNLPVAEISILFILYFLGGYILYSSFYAAIGAAVNSQEDSSQFMMPMMIVMGFAMYAAMGSMENTDGPLAFWASLFPLTSPIVMMVRLPFGVPLWQELLSVALLFGTAILFVWIGSRIYRVGILMYGKKPTFKDIIKWLRY